MNCREYRDELLEQFGRTNLPAELTAHLQSCGECRQFWDDLNVVSQEIPDNTQFYPETHEAELVAEIVEREMRAGVTTRVIRPTAWIRYVAVAAAIVLVSVTATMWKMADKTGVVVTMTDSSGSASGDTSSVYADEELPRNAVATLLEDYAGHAAYTAGEDLLGDLTDEEAAYLETKLKAGDLL